MMHKPDPNLRRSTDRRVAWLVIAASVIVCAVGLVAWLTSRHALGEVERLQRDACHHIHALQTEVNQSRPLGSRIPVIVCPKAGG